MKVEKEGHIEPPSQDDLNQEIQDLEDIHPRVEKRKEKKCFDSLNYNDKLTKHQKNRAI
jgi:hypothetical protein